MKRILSLLFAATLAWAADLTGKWEFKVETSAGSGTPRFELAQKGETLSGRYTGALGEADVKGSVKGDDVEIRFEVSGSAVVYTGKLQKDGTLKGSVDLAGQATGTWTGQRTAK
jgi:hypothetical protein